MQADATNTREKNGTGLGLCIVKQIVDRLGGEVDFAEDLGETLFHVELPCWDQFIGMAIDRDAQPETPRILLCEDDPDMAIVLREQLRQFGFATDFAYTVADAVTLAAATRYCGILTDLQLPDGDGIDLIAQLRDMPEYGEIPIIVVSANPIPARNDARSSELKIFHWLSKPVDFGYLVKAMPALPRIVN
jgi:CheY-like chemotaxis protein